MVPTEGRASRLTVRLALVANLAIAVAKAGAALLTGSASMVAEAAHSFADTGNGVFLLVAQHRSQNGAALIVARVNLVADHPESHVAASLAEMERRLESTAVVSSALLAPAHPGSRPLVR